MNHSWCKTKKVYNNKLLIKLLYITQINKLKVQLLNTNLITVGEYPTQITPYMNTNKVSLYLYAFFRSITAKFRKSYNQGLNYSTLNTYILLSVRCIVADAGHDSKQYILSTKLYKSSYVPKSRLKSMILRRKVNVALRKSKTLGKDVFATNKEFLTI